MSETKKITLNLITPEKQLLNGVQVDMVILPALLGEMGVLPGHIKTIVQLGLGSLRYKQGDKQEQFAVMGGFDEVADLAEEIDEEAEKQKIKAAKESLSRKDADIDFELAEMEIKQAIARMKVKKRKF